MTDSTIPGAAGVDSPTAQMSIPPQEIEFLSRVQKDIEKTTSFRELVYTDIPPSLGASVLDQLNQSPQYTGRKHYNSVSRVLWIRLLPDHILDVHQKWWHDEVVLKWALGRNATPTELQLLWPGVGTTIEFVHGPYAGSRKEPDFYLRADGDSLPRFVIESGWSECYNRLLHDMDLWLVGGNDSVQAVLLLKWKQAKTTDKVSGVAELYGLDRDGMPTLVQTETIFPDPNKGHQPISLTRRILFGSHLLPGAKADSSLALDIADLRVVAADALRLMGCVPA